MRTLSITYPARHGKVICTLSIVLVVMVSGFNCMPAKAGIQFTQLTNQTPFRSVENQENLSADGGKIAFLSMMNLTGNNPDGSSDIFVVNSDGTGLLQVTNVIGGYTGFPSLSGDGSRVAFESMANLNGGNPDYSIEIFMVNTDGTGLIQLTSDSVKDSQSPSLSADGSRIAFQSTADLTGAGTNADGTSDIFVMNTNGTGLVQLTSGATVGMPIFASGLPKIQLDLSADGSKLAFQSMENLTGANPDGSFEVFVINTDGTGLAQLTSDLVGNSLDPHLSADGSRIAFQSTADLTGAGTNADGSYEIFAINIDGTGVVQLTNGVAVGTPVFPSGVLENAIDLSDDGSRVAFHSRGDFSGGNPDGTFEIFLINTDGTGLIQLTSAVPPQWGSYFPSISSNGNRVVFTSSDDPTGGNTDHSPELFIADMTTTLIPTIGGTIVSTNQNPDGSLTYIFQGTGTLGGTYELTLPAGTTASPGTNIEIVIKDDTGQPGRPELEVLNAVFPAGATKTMTIPRPGGIADDVMCVKDTLPKGEVEVAKTCNSGAPGKGPVDLPGNSGDFFCGPGLPCDLGDAYTRHITYDLTTVTVSGLLHSTIYLDIDDAPVADAGADQAVDEGVIASLDGSGSSDADGDALTYAWTMDVAPTGSTLATWTGTGVSPSFLPDFPGDYAVSLVVNDGVQDGAADTVSIHVTANLPPVAIATGYPLSGLAPLTVYFDAGNSYDPELLPIASYSWNFDDPASGTENTSSMVNPSHIYTAVGVYTAVVTVSDDFGNTDQASAIITVTAPNLPPTVAPTATPISGAAPLEVQFASNASGPEVGDELSYSWVLGDGTTSTEAAPLHTYAATGTYIATVTVSDGTNASTATLTISVGSTLTISVTEAKVDFGEHGKVKGKITTKARFTYTGSPAASDTIKVVFDGITLLEAPFGAFKADDDHPGVYKFKQKKMHAKIDFTKGEIKVSRHKMLLNGIDNTNGIDVVISFGNTVGADHFLMAEDEDENDDDRDNKKEMHHKKHHEENHD